DIKSEHCAVYFHAGAFDGLAGFLRESPRDFLFAAVNSVGDPAQYTLAFESGQAARRSESLDCCGNGGLGMFAAPLIDARDHCAVIGSANLDDVTFFQPLPIDVKSMGCNRSHRH